MNNLEPILRTVNLTKRFGEVVANDAITLDIKPGEIHCLLGENGAGKTTVAECIYGFYHPDGGEIFFNGERVKINSPNDAIRLGIGMVHQHFVLIRPMSVIENIVVGTDAARVFLDLTEATQRLEQLCADYDVSLDLNAKIWQLCVGEQQWVEILKALFSGVKLLILDEPTAVLTPQEADKLFVILQQMKQEGLSILFITHKLREVMEVSDRVTVFRKGKKVATVNTADMTQADLAKMMVGRDVVFRVSKQKVEIGKPVLEVKDLKVLNDREQDTLCGVSLEVREKEIVGIAGVSGNGQRELFEAIVGTRHVEKGKIILSGKDVTNKSPRTIADNGVAHIPDDRLEEGLVPDFTVSENLMLGLHKNRFFKYNGALLDTQELDTFAAESIRDYEIATPSARLRTRSLSGGNLQKVIIARELSVNPRVLIANQPSRGLDVGAIEYVHKRMLNQREQGTGILMFSEDLDEIITLADRILVIFKGEIVGELDANQANREEIGLLMAGCMDGKQ